MNTYISDTEAFATEIMEGPHKKQVVLMYKQAVYK